MWWMSILVFQSDGMSPSIDIQHRLVEAESSSAAYDRALELAKLNERSYEADSGKMVNWIFVGLQDLRLCDDQEFKHGSELYGFIRDEVWDVDELVRAKEELTAFGEFGYVEDGG